MEKTIKTTLTLSELEDITHFYLMSSCEWRTKAQEETREHQKKIYNSICVRERKEFMKFRDLRDGLE